MAEPGSPKSKTLQHTWHGLKMVGGDKSLFDLKEPVWHADEKVGGYIGANCTATVSDWILVLLWEARHVDLVCSGARRRLILIIAHFVFYFHLERSL